MRFVNGREVAEVDALRSCLIDGSYKVLVDLLRHERDHRSCCLTDRHESCVESHVSVDLILLHALCPETLTASSDIPVTHVIHKLLKRSCCLRDAVVRKVIIHCLYRRIQLR